MDDFRIIHFFQLKLIDISHIFELVVSETGWKMQIAVLGKGCGLAEGPEGRGERLKRCASFFEPTPVAILRRKISSKS